MMTIDEHIEYWVKNSLIDLKSSSNMLTAGIFDWCLFVGHLALEKMLKAHWVKANQQSIPPKIHNLMKLAELAKIELTENQIEFFRIVNQFHLEARYQDYKDEFRTIATKKFETENLQKINEVFEWLKFQIK
jgi:HEPN domain-containing protein